MFFAHEGNRTDNAFPLDSDNKPVRVFRAFDTKKERDAYREKVWNNGVNNLIDCNRKLVEQYLTKRFGTYSTGTGDSYLCANLDEHERHQYEVPESEIEG